MEAPTPRSPRDRVPLGPALSRRALVARTGASLAGLSIATALGRMTPAQAHAAQVPLTTLSDPEAEALAALGDALLPGAREAGIVEYVDSQLEADQPLLMYRYLDVPIPTTDFYRGALAALDAYAVAQHGQPFAGCAPEQQGAVIGAIATDQAEGWQGPPGSLVYFVVRGDALDVVYGTMDGFAKLGVPYMAHIEPTARW
jgi:hypothetical protein